MQRHRGRFLLVRVEGAVPHVEARVYGTGTAEHEPATLSAVLVDLHDLPEDADGARDLVLLDPSDTHRPAPEPGTVVLRAATPWAEGGPSLAASVIEPLVTHPRQGSGLGADDDRLRGAALARSGGIGNLADVPASRLRRILGGRTRKPDGITRTLRLWWAVPTGRPVEAWVTTVGTDAEPLSWPVLDVPPRFVGATLPARCDRAPAVGEYVLAALQGPDGDVALRPAGRVRAGVEPLQPPA